MKRQIAALALGAAALLSGACASNSEQSESTTTQPAEDPGPTYSPEDMKLVDVPVSRPAPGVKVDAASLPQDFANYAAAPGLSPEQQDCVNGAIKTAVDQDPSLAKTPGKVASVGGKAVTVCDAATVVTEPMLQGLSSSEGDPQTVKLTEQQSACLKNAFATNKDATWRVVAGMMSLNVEALKESFVPFDSTCGVKLSDAVAPS
jgi:hypothetical protein